jgi:hypothetical protein
MAIFDAGEISVEGEIIPSGGPGIKSDSRIERKIVGISDKSRKEALSTKANFRNEAALERSLRLN